MALFSNLAPAAWDFTSNFRNIKEFKTRTSNFKGLAIYWLAPFLLARIVYGWLPIIRIRKSSQTSGSILSSLKITFTWSRTLLKRLSSF